MRKLVILAANSSIGDKEVVRKSWSRGLREDAVTILPGTLVILMPPWTGSYHPDSRRI